MGYQDTWVEAKRAFEVATNKKKPDAGFFHFSGIEPATKELDKALAAPDAVGLAKAQTAFHKAHQEYLKALEKAKKSDKKSDEYKAEIDKLITCLEGIAVDFSKAKGAALLAAEAGKAKAVFDGAQSALVSVLGERRKAVGSALAAERELIGAAGKDTKGRKAAAEEVKAAAKTIEDARKRATAISTKAATDRTSGLGQVDQAVFPVKNGKSDYQKYDDESLAAVMQMRDVVEGMGELLDGAREAEAASKAAVDEAAILASLGRFARVAPTACEVIDSALRTLGGLIDLANFEKINARETEDNEAKERLLRRSREIAGTATGLKANVEADLPSFQEAIEAYRNALPENLRNKPKGETKRAMEEMEEALRGFGDNVKELAKCITKLNKLK